MIPSAESSGPRPAAAPEEPRLEKSDWDRFQSKSKPI